MRDAVRAALSELWPTNAAYRQVLPRMWDGIEGEKQASDSEAPQRRDYRKTVLSFDSSFLKGKI